MDSDATGLIEIDVRSGMDAIAASDWDACATAGGLSGDTRPDDPFTTHAFLSALEDSGSATRGTGWAPQHLVARYAGEVVGAMPLYLKSHSQGEYVFDHSWAHAFGRAGGDYYPKLQASVPFTPATGRRLLVRPDGPLDARTVQAGLLQGACELADGNGLSSVHVTFCTDDEWELGGELGLLQRTDQQFHWVNEGYASFDDFLDALASRKRKTLRKERSRAVENGITIHRLTGHEIGEEHWRAFWHFYQDTGVRKWGRPYLTRDFFDMIHQRRPQDILLVMCARDGRWIAGALNFIGRETLYGRYWGCAEEHPCLHFETCYYQAIEHAIEHGLKRVEAGAQGGHKLARGYGPVTTRSLHHIGHEGLRDAVARYLIAERAAVDRENDALVELTPFRKS